MEEFDCVVVGAGWYGLCAAKQYHCTQPRSSLLVIDSQTTLGGTWAKERLYPGLKSNNLLGTYEYPDFPMDSDTYNIQPRQHIPGETLFDYLSAYAKRFGIERKIRLRNKVVTAEHRETDEGGWVLTIVNELGRQSKVSARRLIVSTGQTSEPWMPRFQGQESFGGNVFHGKQFRQNSETLQTAQRVTVFGGTKLAWDAVYAYATSGVKVDWVIRSTGHGPIWIAPPFVTPLRKWLEKLAHTRMLSWFSPCVWGGADGYTTVRNFLHGSPVGRAIVNTFWKVLGSDVIALMQYDSHPETAKLKPWTDPMFTSTSFSILNYDTSLFDFIRSGDIKVHIDDLDRLSPGTVHLSSGTELKADALLAHTGWKHVPPIKFLPEGIEKELGIPHASGKNAPREDLAAQKKLVDQADGEILRRFPRLKNQPVWNKNYAPLTDREGIETNDEVTPYSSLTPYMLHQFMVPPSERFLRARDIAFVGMVSNFGNTMAAHLQGLWVSAYFSGLLANNPCSAIGDESAMRKLQYNTVLMNRFGIWRYPTDWGSNKCPSFVFDAVPYFDLLQHDLGLSPWRKKGFLAEVYSPYGPEDYRRINEEWMEKQEKTQSSE
ncbi:FAD-dependent monooxygenase DEP4 [Colletotrichum sidae]|uniref:FAD-dependent monooxygenase DEP4 n=1 Tax=Colletotrichum sidae TaxID=1347389 RepID=A0A4R8TTR2_9PEZI|nr:FAD-dependent monooxygenase DEP4 [Colletotrichum sidae]